jgi:hypothetical protein
MLPTEERLEATRALVCAELAKKRSRYAVLRAGRILRRYYGDTAPVDASIFIDDVRLIRTFHVQNDGRVEVWRLVRVEYKRTKKICKLHFRRVR